MAVLDSDLNLVDGAEFGPSADLSELPLRVGAFAVERVEDAVEKMRGPIGSEIIITVVREGVTEPFDVSIIRDTIKLTAVKGRTVGKAVVLRITTFNDQTTSGMVEALKKGTTSLSLEYGRPWEGGEKGVWTFELIVTVK